MRNDKKCVREIREAPMQISNVVAVPYLHRCPPGYSDEKKKDICASSVEVNPEYYCPAGLYLIHYLDRDFDFLHLSFPGWIDNVEDCITTEPPEYAFEVSLIYPSFCLLFNIFNLTF